MDSARSTISGLKTWQVLASLLVFPSIPLGIWFSVLYFYHLNGIETTLLINISMVAVGIIFVINSFDSLIRLYTDNLNLSAQRLGTIPYVLGNAVEPTDSTRTYLISVEEKAANRITRKVMT